MRRYIVLVAAVVVAMMFPGSSATIAAQDESAVVEVSADDRATVSGNTAFGIDLYRHLLEQDSGGNMFLSPASISSAVAMTFAGADGETREQMAQTMHFDLPPERFHAAMGRLSGALNFRMKAEN